MHSRETNVATAADTTTPNTPFYKLGGHETFEAICNRFYDLMDSEPAYAELRAIHAEDLAPMRKALPQFLAAWAGGPRDWFDNNPGRCMMSVHKPYTISKVLGTQWADAMKRAVADTETPDKALATAMGEALSQLAEGMGRD